MIQMNPIAVLHQVFGIGTILPERDPLAGDAACSTPAE